MSGIEQEKLQHFGIYKPDTTILHPSKRSPESVPEARQPEPRALLFDLGHVFLDASYNIIYQALGERGVVREKTKLIFTTDEYDDFARGKIDERTLCDALRTVVGLPDITDEEIREIHDSHIFGLVPGMVELLEKVTQKYGAGSIFFVTDACDWQIARQQQLIDLSIYRVIASNKVGMLKSDPETVDNQGQRRSFFFSVLEELKLQPQEVLLIDDSPEKIATADGYGIQTIQFTNKNQLETDLKKRNILGN